MMVLTVKEAAELLKVQPQWVYRMVRDGGLPFLRLGRQIRIDEDSLEKWLTERRTVGVISMGRGLAARRSIARV
jgi:excisionase family DNA binding protein